MNNKETDHRADGGEDVRTVSARDLTAPPDVTPPGERAKEVVRNFEDQQDALRLAELYQLEEQNRERLEEIFDKSFHHSIHPDDPPESFGRFRSFLTIEYLADAIEAEAKGRGDESETDSELLSTLIQLLASRGEKAEPCLAKLIAFGGMPPEHRREIAEELEAIRASDEPQSFVEVLKEVLPWA